MLSVQYMLCKVVPRPVGEVSWVDSGSRQRLQSQTDLGRGKPHWGSALPYLPSQKHCFPTNMCVCVCLLRLCCHPLPSKLQSHGTLCSPPKLQAHFPAQLLFPLRDGSFPSHFLLTPIPLDFLQDFSAPRTGLRVFSIGLLPQPPSICPTVTVWMWPCHWLTPHPLNNDQHLGGLVCARHRAWCFMSITSPKSNNCRKQVLVQMRKLRLREDK